VNVRAVLEALRHRGPDDEGVFTENVSQRIGQESSCLLVQTRLAIVDLSSSGHQPMSACDGRWQLVFNGEIYNHREIRRELEREGVRFAGASDTEVVLHALVRWGEEAVPRFTGMFALALWDRDSASLLLARDRFGEKPLYFFTDAADGTFTFASEVRTLLASGIVERIGSREGLLSFLQVGSICEPWTVIQNVWAFPPATVASVTAGKVDARRFWENPFYAPPSRTVKQAAAPIRERLVDVVRSQLIADVPVGLFLSAGMDSAAIAVAAAALEGSSVRSFTVSLDDDAMNEGAIASGVATELGLDHRNIHVSASDAMARVPEAVMALDQPSIDGVNTYLISRAVRQAGIVVALSGIGGDEVFAGYTTFRTIQHWMRLNGLLRAFGVAGCTRRAADSTLPLSVAMRKALALAGAKQAPHDFERVLRGLFTEAQVERLARHAWFERPHEEDHPGWLNGYHRPELTQLDAVNALSALELEGYLRNTLLRDTDAMSMAHGLEVRAPFLDHELVALSASVHGAGKIAGPRNKPLLVAAMPGIPEAVSRRPKSGFGLPLDAWLRGPLRGWASDILRSACHGLSSTEASRIWDLFLRRSPQISWSRPWALIVLASWLEQNRVRVA
jgi:asparagine synthase (glutamine-hydrolysing)